MSEASNGNLLYEIHQDFLAAAKKDALTIIRNKTDGKMEKILKQNMRKRINKGEPE